jgi:hypothetical protein
MANNTIQIRRSIITAVPASLANGELAYTSNGNVLYIGDPATGIPSAIGGLRTPGILTANQALVSNSTGYIDVVKAATVYIGTNSLNSVNATSNSTTLGAASNTEVATSWATKNYIDTKISEYVPAAVGSNTQIEYNLSGVRTGSAGLVFNPVSNTITVSNTVSAVNISLSALIANGSTGTGGQILYSGGASNTYWAAAPTISTNTAATYDWTNAHSFSSNVNVTGLATFVDANFTGNVVFSGTSTTVDSVNIKTKDSLIQLADNNLTSDVLSIGLFGSYGNSTVTQYSGLFRDQSDSGYWKFFNTRVDPTGATTIDTANSTYSTSVLKSYIIAGALVSNSTVTNITANSTISSAIVANSITLTTAMLATYGGTGLNSYAAGDLLYAGSSNPTVLSKLTAASNGAILQIVNNMPAYGSLDGGIF